jgi:D-alanyl-D-alanine dipeptidase
VTTGRDAFDGPDHRDGAHVQVDLALEAQRPVDLGPRFDAVDG